VGTVFEICEIYLYTQLELLFHFCFSITYCS